MLIFRITDFLRFGNHYPKFIFFSLCFLHFLKLTAQTYKFAELTGTPLNTKGWNLVGDARVGNTSAGNGSNSELILCNPTFSNSGAAFFNQPVNVSQCQKWTAEFDYRIFDGTGADGIAFCFLANPPTTFTIGGNVGIPNRPIGLMVILDTYLNCPSATPVPKMEIRFYEGNVNFGANTESALECPNPTQPTSGTLPVLRQPTYNRMKITYSFGEIKVFVNNSQVLTGNYKINFPGYFGFTSSTGGLTDRHSIKNFVLYTFKPIVSPPDAGKDITVCNGDSVQLGIPPKANDPYSYSWNPRTNLNNPNIANPKVKVINNSPLPVTYTYFVTKDSLVNDTLCAYSDDIKITVFGKAAQAGADQTLCSGASYKVFGFSQTGIIYKWTPSTGLNDPDIAEPVVQITNKGNAPVTYQYIISATLQNGTCPVTYDTVRFTILPELTNASKNLTLCSGESRQIGLNPAPDTRYNWFPATGLSNADVSNPNLTLVNNTLIPQRFIYVLTSFTPFCTSKDTVSITLLPKVEISGSASVCPNIKGVFYEVKNPVSGLIYDWVVTGGILKTGQGSAKIEVDWGNTNASALVSVNVQGQNCPVVLSVNVNRLLVPPKPKTADTRICLIAGKNVRFETVNTTGSVYTWFVSANGTIASGQGTSVVLVDWKAEGGGKIWVTENSTTQTDACSGTSDTLFVEINPKPDPETVLIKSVSANPNEDKTLVLRFKIQQNPDFITPFTVSRRTFLPTLGNWETAGTVNKTDSVFTDKNLTISELSYEYKIDGKDRCELPVTTQSHHSLVLKAESEETDSTAKFTLTWNDYTTWKNGVKTYEIWRKLDDETGFKLYATVGANVQRFQADAKEGFVHHYRILAIENQGFNSVSFSNEVSIEFDRPLYIPNLITPGNDDKNEFWVIGNLKLYPKNELVIFNRYGREVLNTQNYAQNWNASNLSNGTYFFTLKTEKKNRQYQGWIMVVK